MQKSVVISGGSNGIGQATALRLAEDFDQVYILDIESNALKHPKIHTLLCDVTDLTALESAKQTISQNSTLHAIVSNAGVLLSKPFERASQDEIFDTVNINLLGTIYLLKVFLPLLKAQKHGDIVTVASDQSFIGKANNVIYGATKAAVAQLTKGLAVENADYDIRVNCVCPGTVDTPLYRRAVNNASKKSGESEASIFESLAKEQPMKRVGKPEEIAELIAFVLSRKAAFMTGALLPIDGGYTAQ